MASSSVRPTHFRPSPPLRLLPPFHRRRPLILRASATTTDPDDDLDSTPEPYELQPPSLKLEKRQKAALLRDSRSTGVRLPDPPNFEVGWKRTKPIDNRKPRGFVVADFVEKLELLIGRGQFGSVELLVKAGGIVVERAREEAESIVARSEEEEGEEAVDEMVATELFRVLRLLEMDLQMLKAAVKEETRAERLEQARARCRQTIRVALSL